MVSTRRRGWTPIVAVAALLIIAGCGGNQTSGMGPDGDQALTKPAAKISAPYRYRSIVEVTLTEGGIPVEGAQVSFARSVSGDARVYAWSGTTDANGQAEIEITADTEDFLKKGASGYYMAKATDPETSAPIGSWGSIPIQGGKTLKITLPVGSRCQIASRTVLPAGLRAADAYRVEEIWNTGNLAAVDEIVARDYLYHEPYLGPIAGREALKQTVGLYRTVYAGLHFATEDMIVEGDKVVTRWTGTGTHAAEMMGIPATGLDLIGTGITMVRYRGQKMVEEWSHWDLLGNLQQMGAIPAGGRTTFTWGTPLAVTGDPGDPEANKAIVRRVIDEIWNQQDLDAADELFSADPVNDNPMDPTPSTIEAMKQKIGIYLVAFPDMAVTIHDEVAEGGKVAIRWTVDATHGGEFAGLPATGNTVQWKGFSIYRIADGKVVEVWWSYNALAILQQIGLVPAL